MQKISFLAFLILLNVACSSQLSVESPLVLEEQKEQVITSFPEIISFSGQLLDWRAKPIAKATISVTSAQGEQIVETDRNGFYSFQIERGVLDSLMIAVQSAIGNSKLRIAQPLEGVDVKHFDLMLGADDVLVVIN